MVVVGSADGELASRARKLLATAEGGGRSDVALRAAVDCVALFKELNDPKSVAQALQSLAKLHLQAGEPEKALPFAEEALDLFLAQRQRMPEEAEAVSCAVQALLAAGHAEPALRAARHGREACQEAGLRCQEAAMLELLASTQAAVGRPGLAERAARQALRLYAGELHDLEGEKRTLRLISHVRLSSSGREEAAAGPGVTVGDAVAFSEAGNVRAAAETLHGLVEDHLAAGRGAEMLAEANALRERCLESGDRVAAGIASLVAANAQLGLAEHTDSLQTARGAAEVFEEEGETSWWAVALSVIARVYSEKGQLGMAQQYARNASRKFAAAGEKSARDVSMRLLVVHTMLVGPESKGQHEGALREAEAALAAARELPGQRGLQATALGAISKAHSVAGRPEEALAAANRALQLLDDDDVQGRSRLLLHSTDICLVLKRYEDALPLSLELVALAKKDGDSKFLELAEDVLQKIERCQRG